LALNEKLAQERRLDPSLLLRQVLSEIVVLKKMKILRIVSRDPSQMYVEVLPPTAMLKDPAWMSAARPEKERQKD
jgi:hypothetical protein